jgi:hypothetical protein
MTDQNIMHNTKNPRQGGGCTWRGSLLGGENPTRKMDLSRIQGGEYRPIPSYVNPWRLMASHGVSCPPCRTDPLDLPTLR